MGGGRKREEAKPTSSQPAYPAIKTKTAPLTPSLALGSPNATGQEKRNDLRAVDWLLSWRYNVSPVHVSDLRI
jgi:hypothetical protein